MDAEAICEAHIAPVHALGDAEESQQTLSALHQVRESLVCDRTKTINQLLALLEFAISLQVGITVISQLPALLSEHRLPPRSSNASTTRL